jgi:hypothetical protein
MTQSAHIIAALADIVIEIARVRRQRGGEQKAPQIAAVRDESADAAAGQNQAFIDETLPRDLLGSDLSPQ